MSDEKHFTEESSKWDSRELGASEEYVEVAPAEISHSVMDAIGLKPISLRLQVGLIEDLKFIAKSHGIGYQPLIRDILNRFVACEKKKVMRDLMETKLHELQSHAISIDDHCEPQNKIA